MSDEHNEPVNEYEREPVPDKALLGLKSYVGQFAGEHVAGTEIMIGPLFLAAGVSAFDFIVGLLVGNLLAVLSWTLFTAPIATRCRLTVAICTALVKAGHTQICFVSLPGWFVAVIIYIGLSKVMQGAARTPLLRGREMCP